MTDIKLEFAPGCFNDFVGTQEELDALVTQIKEMARNGQLLEASQLDPTIDPDDFEELEYRIIDISPPEPARLH